MSDIDNETKARTVFISHRHEDRLIADALREFVDDLPLARSVVYQSTFPENGPRIGRQLTRELREQLHATDVVFCIFTRQDEDWSYCMWECGVATDPLSDDTRVVIFQFSSDCPSPYRDQVRVKVSDRTSVHAFVNSLLTEPDFFPGFSEPVAPHWRAEKIARMADELFERLTALSPMPPAPVEEWPAWAYLRVQLALADVEKWKLEADGAPRLAAAKASLLADGLIVDGDLTARNLFGRARFPSGTRFAELVDDWGSKYPDSSPAWVDSLAKQVMLAGMWKFPEPDWIAMRGASHGETDWCIPVLNWVRRIPEKAAIQFDIYFIPVRQDNEVGQRLLRTA